MLRSWLLALRSLVRSKPEFLERTYKPSRKTHASEATNTVFFRLIAVVLSGRCVAMMAVYGTRGSVQGLRLGFCFDRLVGWSPEMDGWDWWLVFLVRFFGSAAGRRQSSTPLLHLGYSVVLVVQKVALFDVVFCALCHLNECAFRQLAGCVGWCLSSPKPAKGRLA